jgi:hypothetical protein
METFSFSEVIYFPPKLLPAQDLQCPTKPATIPFDQEGNLPERLGSWVVYQYYQFHQDRTNHIPVSPTWNLKDQS